jgi:nitrate/TMAO reductase-like tetraheme cytochrome c subunit
MPRLPRSQALSLPALVQGEGRHEGCDPRNAGRDSTEEKFKKERLRLAKHVWEEFKENNSQACRNCHQFSKDVLAKQKEFVQPMHQQVLEGKATCIDCHKGIAHTAPQE